MSKQYMFIIYDERALSDSDEASVLLCTSDLEEDDLIPWPDNSVLMMYEVAEDTITLINETFIGQLSERWVDLQTVIKEHQT